MVSYDQSQRPTIEEICLHPWMNDVNFDRRGAKVIIDTLIYHQKKIEKLAVIKSGEINKTQVG